MKYNKPQIKKLIIIVLVLFSMISLCIYLFVPMLYVQSYAQSQISSRLTGTTTIEKFDLWQPKLLIFSMNQDVLKADIITLERSEMGIFWRVKDQHWVYQNLNDEELKNLEKLNQKIKSVRQQLRSGEMQLRSLDSDIDIEGINSGDSNSILENVNNEESINGIVYVYSKDNEYELKIIPKDIDSGQNTLELNGQQIDGLSNIMKAAFDTNGAFLYFQKKSEDKTVLQRLNLEEGTIEEMFETGNDEISSIFANSNYLVTQASNLQKISIYSIDGAEKSEIDLNQQNFNLKLDLKEIDQDYLYFSETKINSDNSDYVIKYSLELRKFVSL